MNGPRPRPSNMSDLCRLCLSEGEITSPIFAEEDSSSSQVPLPFRIMACVSVEVSMSDSLPKVICDKCLNHVNSWHEFKQICDSSQETLKQWLNNSNDNVSTGIKDVVIKQEPVDPESEDDVLEIIDETLGCQIMVEDIKQEVDMYGENGQDDASVEIVEPDPLGLPDDNPGSSLPKDVENMDVEDDLSDVSHLRITDIKTECGDIIPISEVGQPTDGRLLRSVLQGKKLAMYSKKVPAPFQEVKPLKPFQCRLCEKSFAYNYLLKRHAKTHKGDRNVCAYCQQSFSTHSLLVQHVRCYNGTISIPYTCDHCQQEFPCRSHYLSHVDGSDGSGCDISLIERDESQEDSDLHGQVSSCGMCQEKFPSILLLRLHMRKDHFQYTCHKCDRTYSNGVALSNHLRSHSLGTVRLHCETCPRTFSKPELLRKHERTHLKDNPPMAMIPADIGPSESTDQNTPAESPVAFMDRPIKEEPLDSPQTEEMDMDMYMASEPIANSLSSHVCHLCNENFPTIASLRFHLKGVHLHFQCHRCPKVYASGVALSNHLRSHSLGGVRKHKCLVCLKSFTTLESLTRHKKSHSAPGNMEMQKQSEKKLNPASPSNYLEGNEDALLYQSQENKIETLEETIQKRTCKICNLVSASRSALERHMASHIKVKMYSCTICSISMSYASSLQKHYRVLHKKNIELRDIQKNPDVNVDELEHSAISAAMKEDEYEKPPICTKSGRKVIFNKTFRMTAQLQTVAKLPAPFECKICRRSFAYRSFLIKHSKIHGDNTSDITCNVCLKKFPDAKTLNNHKGVHSRFKHFSCNICGESFNGVNAWQKHERMHQKGYIYSCKLCGKKFMSRADLHAHKKLHISVKIYTCAVCKNSYHSSSALGKHKRRHGHWYASPEQSETSDVEVVDELPTIEPAAVKPSEITVTPVITSPGARSRVLKPGLSKAPSLKTAVHKSLLNRPAVSIPFSRYLTHFPSGKKRPQCNICKKPFSHMSALRKHKYTHHKNPPQEEKSPPAPKQSKIKFEVPERELVVTEDNTCLTCDRSFPDHVSLVRHKGWHTRRSGGNYEPPDYTTPKKLTTNPCFVKLESTPFNTYPCTLCSEVFTASSALEYHMNSHSKSTSPAVKTGEVRCKVTADISKTEVLTSSRRLACKICKKPFESKKALITHIGWHSRVANNPSLSFKPKASAPKVKPIEQFSCDVCNKMFSSALILSKHKKLHTRKLLSSIKEKPIDVSETNKDGPLFTCTVCHKSFKMKRYLILHMRLHTGEKKFKCNICHLAYHRSGSLWKHKRIHHGLKVFSCHVCQKRFGLRNQLTKHLQVHERSVDFVGSDTVFACSRCDKTFPTLTKFRQHEKCHG